MSRYRNSLDEREKESAYRCVFVVRVSDSEPLKYKICVILFNEINVYSAFLMTRYIRKTAKSIFAATEGQRTRSRYASAYCDYSCAIDVFRHFAILVVPHHVMR